MNGPALIARGDVMIRHLVRVDPDELQRIAFHAEVDIEIDNANDRAYVRIDATTFVAELAPEVCS